MEPTPSQLEVPFRLRACSPPARWRCPPGWSWTAGSSSTASGAPRSSARPAAGCRLPRWGLLTPAVHGRRRGRRSTAATPRRRPRSCAPTSRTGPPRWWPAWSPTHWTGSRRPAPSLASLADDGVVAGIHLEGPWLSPARAGARTSRRCSSTRRRPRSPGWSTRPADTCAWSRSPPSGRVRCPRSPSWSPPGVVAAVGHTDATYDETRAALEAGATAGTHLFNAMPPLHHREPGPVAALLSPRRTSSSSPTACTSTPPCSPGLADRPHRPGHRRHGGDRRGRR